MHLSSELTISVNKSSSGNRCMFLMADIFQSNLMIPNIVFKFSVFQCLAVNVILCRINTCSIPVSLEGPFLMETFRKRN